jgi:hypothetical protein
MTPRHGFLTHTQFSWHITGLTFNYARDRFCGDDLFYEPFYINGGDYDNPSADHIPTPWHVRQDRLAKYRGRPGRLRL